MSYRKRTRRLRIVLISSFIAGIAMFITVKVLSGITISNLTKSNFWVSHTHRVIEQTTLLTLTVRSLESAARGYAATGNPEFLKNYEASKKDIRNNLDSLFRLVSDNRDQHNRVSDLKMFIVQKMDGNSAYMAAKQAGDILVVDSMLRSLHGKFLMDSISKRVDIINNEERILLAKREADSRRLSSRAERISEISSVLAILLLGISGIFIFFELSKREKLQKQLAAEEQLLKQLLDAVPVGVLILKKDKRVLFSNLKLNSYFNLQNYELHDPVTNWLNLKNIRTGVSYRAKSLPFLNAFNGLAVNETGIIDPGNPKLIFQMIAEPVQGEHGQVEYVICVFADITAIEQTARELEKARELAVEAMKLKENFLANMSHEIRTPLNAITGFSDLLLIGEHDKEKLDYALAIRNASSSLLTIINDILDFSKIEAGMISMEKITFNLPGTLESFRMLLQHRAKAKGIDYNFQADSSLPELVSGDPVRLTQVLTNLVGNAIKFTDNGNVSVLIERVRDAGETAIIRFTVSDTGIGIAREQLDNIFERFGQAGNDINRRFGGTGLGLNISRSLVELMGGTVTVQSLLGEGSIFTVEIPFEKSSEEEATKGGMNHSVKMDPSAWTGIHILLVEDNKLNQKLAKTVLDNYGFEVSIAENGRLALEMLSLEKFDLILLDVQMPEMDGYETIHAIRNDLKSDIPVIAMTAHALSTERDKCIQAGMNDYLSKPFNREDLLTKISMYLHKPGKEIRNSGPALSFDYLEQLADGNEDFMTEILQIWLKQTPEDVTDLENSTLQMNWVRVHDLAHKLRASCQVIRIGRVEELLQMIEEISLTPQAGTQIPAMTEKAARTIRSAIPAIDQKVAGLEFRKNV